MGLENGNWLTGLAGPGGAQLGTPEDDLLDGGPGSRILIGRRGDDRLVLDAEPGPEPQDGPAFYTGGRGEDTLALELSEAQWADPDVRIEVLAFLDWIEAGSRGVFVFEAFGVTVHSVEALDLRVDGVLIEDPREDEAPVVYDLSGSASDEVVAPSGDLNYAVTTGSGDDLVETGAGSDVISTGDGDDTVRSDGGDDIIAIGNGDDVVDAGGGDDLIIAGVGGGIDLIDGNAGNDTVAYPSCSNPIAIDLRTENRSGTDLGGGLTVGALLASEGYAETTPVGVAEGVDVEKDVLLSVENAEGGSGADTLIGNDDANRLRGVSPLSENKASDGGDVLAGNGGDDILEGGAGADTLDGGAENDRLAGGAGDDAIDGGTGLDTLVLQGNLGDYTFTAQNDGTFIVQDSVAGRDGTDTIFQIEDVAFANTEVGLWSLVDTIERFGNQLDNTLIGTAARERFFGREGDDELYGMEAEDQFIGGSGADLMDGGSGTSDDANFVWDIVDYWLEYELGGTQGVSVDLATGVATDTYGFTDTLIDIERVFGTEADDILIGNDDASGNAFDPYLGTDIIEGRGGYDNLRYNLAEGWGAPGGITVTYSQTDAYAGTVIDMGGYTDTFSGIEAITATAFADTINGGIGDDRFTPIAGDDLIDGGAGFDRVSYAQDASYGGLSGIVMPADTDGGARTVTDGFGNTDTLISIEWISGTGARDQLTGNASDEFFETFRGDDYLAGEGGDDRLHGGDGVDEILGGTGEDFLSGDAGRDVLSGGAGNDFLRGGLDADTFIFAANTGRDVVEDFSSTEDRVELVGVAAVSVSATDFNSDGVEDASVILDDGGEIIFQDVDAATMETILGFV